MSFNSERSNATFGVLQCEACSLHVFFLATGEKESLRQQLKAAEEAKKAIADEWMLKVSKSTTSSKMTALRI